MAYFSPKKPIVRDPNKLGVVDGSQVYDMIQEATDHYREFHSTEPAIVNRVYMKSTDLPKKKLLNYEIPDWKVYGTIDATFIYSSEPLPNYIKPLTHNIITYPLKGEVVNITKYGGEYYYTVPLNLNQKVNMNRPPSERGDGTVVPQHTKFNRRVWSWHGDTVVQGRFGNSVKLGSDSLYQTPTIKIVNGQNQKTETLQYKNVESDYPHIEDINSDGSSIYMTAGIDEVKLIPAAVSNNLPTSLYGNQIILNSDRLIFNAKGKVNKEGVSLTGTIHMLAADDFILSAGDQFVLEAEKIYLGSDADPARCADIVRNPLVKYDELKSVLGDMVSVLEGLTAIVDSATQNEDGESTANLSPINSAISSIKEDLPTIASGVVFTNYK
tara:strand:- start:5443 stop:6591 length:1149 start_codon:yes stop_codon:yes gene_type:complete